MIRTHILPVFLMSLLLTSAALRRLADDPEVSNVRSEPQTRTAPPAPDDMILVAAGTTPGGYVTITNAFWITGWKERAQ